MKFCLSIVLMALPWTMFAQPGFAVLTREHADLTILYNPGATSPFRLVLRDEDRATDHDGTEVILVVREQARLTLPAGTPFGDGGQPIWILPQTQNPSLLYLGVSAEGINPDAFSGPVVIRLKAMEGPGYFMAWQATGPGQFNIRVNTRDGIGSADAFTPIVGSHEHFNWGFSTTGVYCLTFDVVGRRTGETTNLVSPEFTFGFQVLPLPPPTNFATWQKHFWPPGFAPSITAAGANPDQDVFDNLQEYAFGSSPTNVVNVAEPPRFDFVTNGTHRFGALTFARYLPARDLEYSVAVAGDLTGPWLRLTNVIPGPFGSSLSESVTVRDFESALTNHQRLLLLQINRQ